MMRRRLLDSSVCIPLLLKTDVFSNGSKKWFESLDAEEEMFVLPRLVRIEVLNVMFAHGFNEVTLIDGLFSQLTLAELDEGVYLEAVRLLVDGKVRLKTSDLIIVATAKLYQADLVSWDRRLVREAGNVVRAYIPGGK